MYVEDGGEEGGGGGVGAGSGDSDPCAACDPDGAGICTNQESGGIPQSCAIDFNISVITDPCQLADLLEDDAIFRSYMLMLVSDANTKNRETAWTFYKAGNGNPIYSYHQGPVGGDLTTLILTNPIDGAMHQHYDFDGSLSIFSADDLLSIYQMYNAGKINNLETFTFGLVTHFGTRYMLKIDDVNALLSFFNSNFSNNSQFESFSFIYEFILASNRQEYGNVLGEKIGFLKMLRDYNTGIKMFEANPTFTVWTGKKLNSSGTTVITDNCN